MPAPSLALLFADTRTLPTGVSFTRTTEAWYWEQDLACLTEQLIRDGSVRSTLKQF
jgi:hypothetical protein